MLVNEDLECVVCCSRYSRRGCIPRLLHCKHTFCAPCLLKLSRPQGALCTIRCPLCRWLTCTCATLPLPGSLYVNTEIWDQIAEDEDGGAPMEHTAVTQLHVETFPHSKNSAFKSCFQKLWRCVDPS